MTWHNNELFKSRYSFFVLNTQLKRIYTCTVIHDKGPESRCSTKANIKPNEVMDSQAAVTQWTQSPSFTLLQFEDVFFISCIFCCFWIRWTVRTSYKTIIETESWPKVTSWSNIEIGTMWKCFQENKNKTDYYMWALHMIVLHFWEVMARKLLTICILLSICTLVIVGKCKSIFKLSTHTIYSSVYYDTYVFFIHRQNINISLLNCLLLIKQLTYSYWTKSKTIGST